MPTTETRYIFITGGVTSSLGKGIISAALAKLLQSCGLRVSVLNLGTYLNVDHSTINPYENGECFITNDGGEVDLDIGHYERFLCQAMSSNNNITSGQIYQNVIARERRGDYLGKVVQTVPHLTDEIKRNILNIGNQNKFDVVVVEIGGTVGDIESLPYIEAIRQLKWEIEHRAMFIHLTFVPYLSAANEQKTKPTQHSVKQLFENGIQPDVILLRSESEISAEQCHKVAQSCNLDSNAVVQLPYLPNIYEIPQRLHEQQLDKFVFQKLKYQTYQEPNLSEWTNLLVKQKQSGKKVKIAIIGNYVEQPEAYKSITESLCLSAMHECIAADVRLIHSENITNNNISEKLKGFDAIVIASDNGRRGVEGKKATCRYARENSVPMLAIGTAMRIMIDEYRNAIKDSVEIINNDIQPKKLLGNRQYIINKEAAHAAIFQKEEFEERSRFDCNVEKSDLENLNFTIVATEKESGRVAMIEKNELRWYVACAFRPEYNGTFLCPNPLFMSLVHEANENYIKQIK